MRREPLLALAMAAVLTGGVIAATTMTPAAHDQPVAAPSPTLLRTPSPTPLVPTRTPTPAPKPSTITPSATRSPSPSLTPLASQTISKSGPRGEFAPLAIKVTQTPGKGTTQTPFSLRVQASDGDGWARITSLTWGDGSEYLPSYGVPSCASPAPEPRYKPRPTSFDELFAHAWRLPGAYRVRVLIDSGPGPCSYGSRATRESQQAVFSVSVNAADEVTSNGPALPKFRHLAVNPSYEGNRTAELHFGMFDTDGAIRRYLVDWGDGTRPEPRLTHRQECEDGGGRRYPGMQEQDRYGAAARHRYAKAGRYRVVVTVFSSGCDDKDVQQVQAGGSVRVID